MIKIISNGSKFYGQKPDDINRLLEVLKTYALDLIFVRYGDFIETPTVQFDDVVRFHGNFSGLSHVFNISTDEPELIGTLTAAIRENQVRQEVWR